MKILLAITGSIAAIKIFDLIRRIQADGHMVQCIVTKNALEFISKLSLEAISQHEILGPDVFEYPNNPRDIFSHISISQAFDSILIAPASANTIAKIAHGIADDFLGNVVLAAKNIPLLLAPAMNEYMWSNPATQANIQTLQHRGYIIIPPQKKGMLACGVEGEGKMASIETLFSFIKKYSTTQKYADQKILISLGGTREYIDSARYIGNASSGKTGIAIANAFFEMGAIVQIVAGINTQAINEDIFSVFHVDSTQKMLEKMNEQSNDADIIVFCAAVADFMPVKLSTTKIEKNDKEDIVSFSFQKTPDIAKTLSLQKKENQIYIGFCLADENLHEKMMQKMHDKGFDMIIGNTAANIGSENGSYEVYNKKTKTFTQYSGNKTEILKEIIQNNTLS